MGNRPCCQGAVKGGDTAEAQGDEPALAVQGDSLQKPGAAEEVYRLPRGAQLTVMMFGMTGAGKSALGNLIAGSTAFETGDNTTSVTNLDSVMRCAAEDDSFVLLDTIGLGDTEIDQEKVVSSIRDVALSAPNGVDVLLFVMRNQRITDDAIARLIYVTEYLWGHECLLNLYIVVTCAARYLSDQQAGRDWINRQAEINWRFKHIYAIVGNNPHRFIFVDNPDPHSGEPDLDKRHHASRQALMKTLVHHPRNIIPPFTSAMMKRAQELTESQRKNLKEKEEEVIRLQQEQSELDQKAPALNPANGQAAAQEEKKKKIAKNLSRAQEDKEAAAKAMHQKLIEVKADQQFRDEAEQQGSLATINFVNQYKLAPMGEPGQDDGRGGKDLKESTQACRRMADKLATRFSMKRSSTISGKSDMTAGGTPATASASAAPVSLPKIEDREHVLDQIVARIRASLNASATDVFAQLGGWKGAGAIQPAIFNSFVQSYDSGITLQQVGGLWRRADRDCDGQLDLEEFRNFLKDPSAP